MWSFTLINTDKEIHTRVWKRHQRCVKSDILKDLFFYENLLPVYCFNKNHNFVFYFDKYSQRNLQQYVKATSFDHRGVKSDILWSNRCEKRLPLISFYGTYGHIVGVTGHYVHSHNAPIDINVLKHVISTQRALITPRRIMTPRL